MLEIEDSGDEIVVRFSEPQVLTPENLASVREQLFRIVAERERPRLRLDGSRIHILDSDWMEMLVGLQQKLRDAGGRLTLFNLDPDMAEVFSITRLDTLFSQ